MHRFYCPALTAAAVATISRTATPTGPILLDQPVTLEEDESHHASRVLRLKPGAAAEVFDGLGCWGIATVATVDRHEVALHVGEIFYEPASRPAIWIATAVAKGSRPDEMVNQLSQVGIAGWQPLLTQRSVVQPREGKVEKLRRSAIAAAKQARRAHLLEVAEPVSLSDALSADASLKLWATTQQPAVASHDLNARLAQARKVMVYIGPEGGWSDQEEALAIEAGAQPWRMGDSIMRIETAAVAAAAILQYMASDSRTSESTA